ncbi:hypothetical protein L0244_29655 [bacterium]|nr:hypothetical protein [bacterium]
MPLFKGKNIRRNQGVMHRPDDVARVASKSQYAIPANVIDGQIVAPIDQEDFYALNTARRIREVRNTITNTTVTIDFDSICVGVEVINDDASASIGVAFGGDLPSVPADSTAIVNTSEVKPKESRFYNVHVNKMAIVTSGTAVEFRVTILLP